MKQIRNKWLGLYQKMLGGLLILLGFSSCDKENPNNEEPGGGLCMYGTPSAEYRIKGTVTDKDGRPVTSANVIIRNLGYESQFAEDEALYKDVWLNDTLKVNDKGEYLFVDRDSGWGENDFRVVVHDVAHKPDSVKVTLVPKDGDGAWFEGTGEETVNFRLEGFVDGTDERN